MLALEVREPSPAPRGELDRVQVARAVVADVQDPFVGGERQPVGLVEARGDALCAAGGGVDVLDAGGARLGRFELPGAVNFWLEGERLFITADTAIWETRL